jgi:hypothetical protein
MSKHLTPEQEAEADRAIAREVFGELADELRELRAAIAADLRVKGMDPETLIMSHVEARLGQIIDKAEGGA